MASSSTAIFRDENFISLITIEKTSGSTELYIPNVSDHVLWFGRNKEALKFRQFLLSKIAGGEGGEAYAFVQTSTGERIRSSRATPEQAAAARAFRLSDMTSQSIGRTKGEGAASWFAVQIQGRELKPSEQVRWKTNEKGMQRLIWADRLEPGKNSLNYVRFIDDYPAMPIRNVWTDVGSSLGGDKLYVVQTSIKIVERCILMATDPGDLVLDPTCGSGTTATVAEQWGRRWITIDTSRVALALARARIMGARYPFYLLADSREGQIKDAEVTRTAPSSQPVRGNIRHGFVYERVPHITLKSIANNAEIDVIWDQWQAQLEPLRVKLNKAVGKNWEEWEIPRDISDIIGKEGGFQKVVLPVTPSEARRIHEEWWTARIARQQEIDKSIAAKAEFEYLYDKPYDDKKTVRVAGPFTVESLSPHRMLGVDENDELIDSSKEDGDEYGAKQSFPQMILENLKTAGVQQAHKEDRVTFTALSPWPGELVCAEGRYLEGEIEKRAAICIGPEFGTVQRADLVAAAREAGDAGFDVLIACAFNYEAHTRNSASWVASPC
jgi:adenine-specific DNA-methyltransferase